MDISRNSCRICLAESEFNASLFSNYCQRTNMIDKILVCLKLVVEETDVLNTICYRCAENIERYYDFITCVKKSQIKLSESRQKHNLLTSSVNRRHLTSYVREEIFDADYTFSFLDMSNNDDKKESKPSSSFFSYFSPPDELIKSGERIWKTPKPLDEKSTVRHDKYKRRSEPVRRHHSRDLFESQSPDVDEDPKSLDWKLTPDDNILKRVRDKCFGRNNY